MLTASFVYIVETRLKEIIQDRFGGFYTIEYTDMIANINPFSVSVVVHDADIKFDTLHYVQDSKLPRINFAAKKIKISGINTWDIIRERDIIIGNIDFEVPKLQYFLVSKRDTSKHQNSEKQPAILNKKRDRNFIVENFSIEKGTLDIFGVENYDHPVFKTRSIDIGFKDLQILKKQSSDLSFIQFTQALIISKKSIYQPLESDYFYNVDSLYLDKVNNIISLNGIKALCDESLIKHSTGIEERKMFAESKMKSLVCNGIDFDRITDYGQVHISHMFADSASVKLLQNFKKDLDFQLEKKTLREMVTGIDFPIKIDTLSLKKVSLYYTIFDYNGSGKTSNFDIKSIHGEVYNMNSIKGSSDTMLIDFDGKFLNTGAISFKASMPLADTTNHYTYSGVISHLEFHDFNKFLNGFVPIDFTEGTISHIRFNARATKLETWGRLTMEYDNLKFEVINTETNKKSRLKTMVAKLFIRKKNTSETNADNYSNYHHVKPQYKGQVVLWVGGVLQGIKDVMLRDMAKGAAEKQINKQL